MCEIARFLTVPRTRSRDCARDSSQTLADGDRIRRARSGLALAGFALALIAPLTVAVTPSPVSAHGRSVSYSSWEIDEAGATVSVRLKLLELSRLGPAGLPPGTVAAAGPPGSPDLPARAFPRELELVADGEACVPDPVAARRPDEAGWVRYEWRVHCADRLIETAERLAIRTRLLLAVAPSHMHFARVRQAATSEGLREQVLTEAAPEFVLRTPNEPRASESIGSGFLDYLLLGIEHILSGWDHLAFVFGLLLLAGRLGEVARLITGFTLAHSLTLALAVLGVVHPNAVAVESVIAFSVALVAIEKGWQSSGQRRSIPIAVTLALCALAAASLLGISSLPTLTVVGLVLFTTCYFGIVASTRSEWLRISLTFAFGLVHGFGFAGILVEMTLPTERLVPALLGFNVGVELGQISIVVLIWPMLVLANRAWGATLVRRGGDFAAAGLCGLGVYWLIERAFA